MSKYILLVKEFKTATPLVKGRKKKLQIHIFANKDISINFMEKINNELI
jgi:hypothetical protein